MPAENLDFSVDLTGVDRRGLLDDAARRVAVLESHLGERAEQEDGPGPTGELLRGIDEDIAEFGAFPLVYPIVAADFRARDGAVPDGFDQLSVHNAFYRVEFPINLFARSSWSFDRLEVRIEFNHGDDGATRPKAFQLFPDQQVASLARGSLGVRLSVDSKLKFAIAAPPTPPVAEAQAGAEGSGDLGLSIGPFQYEVTRMVVQTSKPGLEKAFWRLENAKALLGGCPPLVVILQVPNGAVSVRAACALRAYRNYNFLADRVRRVLSQLPRAISTFFRDGAPLPDERSYDLSAACLTSSG